MISRPLAEMRPRVTVSSSPKGSPMATAQSPTRSASESPNSTALSPCGGSSSAISARSVGASSPLSLAESTVPSARRTLNSSAPSMTWWFVTMSPAASMMKPEPSPRSTRVPLWPWPKGTPKNGESPPSPPDTSRCVVMPTTEGRTRSTRSATEQFPAALAKAGRKACSPGRSANSADATRAILGASASQAAIVQAKTTAKATAQTARFRRQASKNIANLR